MRGFEAFEVLKPIADAIAPHVLYAVGGAVRDALRGRLAEKPDFDVCSDLSPERLAEMVKGKGMTVEFPHGGVASATIVFGELRCEYTAFRRDEYAVGTGSHTPIGYHLVSTPQEDAPRRDFRCNAVYWDVAKGTIVDPLGGVRDIEDKILRTTRDAETVIAEDPVRILRAARFAAALGFGVEEETARACRRHIDDVDALSPSRKRHEWDGLMRGEHLVHGLTVAYELGLLAKLFPALAACAGVEQPTEHHAYDALRHAFECAAAAPQDIKLAALLHDEGKAEAIARDGNMHEHALYGAASAERELTALGYPKREVGRICRLIAAHMYDINNSARTLKLRRFIVQNADIIDDICALMRADSVATGKYKTNPRADRIEAEIEYMREKGVPLRQSDLAVDGSDLAAIGFEGKAIAEELARLFEMCLKDECLNQREALLEKATKKMQKFAKPQQRHGRKK